MRYFSFHDALTGLYNRAYFEEELKSFSEVEKFRLEYFLRCKGLKLVNDAFGHQAGTCC